MTKCTLIEVDNDRRAVICVGDGSKGVVKTTAPIDWIDYETQEFETRGRRYDFAEVSDLG